MYENALIEDLFIPFSAVSTDVTSGEQIVHRRGPVWLAVRASSSLPGAWPAVQLDGKLLVDGGLLNNLPVDVIQPRCKLGAVIASDISAAGRRGEYSPYGASPFRMARARGNVQPIVAKIEGADYRRAACAVRHHSTARARWNVSVATSSYCISRRRSASSACSTFAATGWSESSSRKATITLASNWPIGPG